MTDQMTDQLTDQMIDQMNEWNRAPSQIVVKPAAAAQGAGAS